MSLPNITVDEQLLGFRRRGPFSMYVPNKAEKHGVKLVLINDNCCKYLFGVVPYLGEEEYATKECCKSWAPLHHEIVEAIHNWSSSVQLSADLLNNRGMAHVGIISNTREIPDEMRVKQNREPGSSAFLFTSEMKLVSHTKPSQRKTPDKLVLLISSFHTQPKVTER